MGLSYDNVFLRWSKESADRESIEPVKLGPVSSIHVLHRPQVRPALLPRLMDDKLHRYKSASIMAPGRKACVLSQPLTEEEEAGKEAEANG